MVEAKAPKFCNPGQRCLRDLMMPIFGTEEEWSAETGKSSSDNDMINNFKANVPPLSPNN